MKKVLGILTTTGLALTLAACSGGDNNESNQSQDKTSNNETSQNKTNENNTTNQSNNQPKSNMNQSSQKQPSVDEIVQNLTDEEKYALALYESGINDIVVTPNDLANGQYEKTHNGGHSEIKTISRITLVPGNPNGHPGTPSNVRLYGPSPAKTTAGGTGVLISDDQVVIYITQSPKTYDQIVNDPYGASHVFNVKDLYNRHSSEDYKGLASKIVIGQAPSEETSQAQDTSSSSSSSSSSIKVTRENVIDLVEDYEGHLLDTNTYTYKEPAQLGDGSWGFSFLDKAGNLAGSYIVSADGVVTKYDEKGIEE
ncbi:lipoprotein [Staphylococcus microti]|uniref:Lipoprotein n=1 Tax=Staphylococcus microti TaxID=569857 RepID=A0A380GSB7_9STAP|nr:hypothetical protein [Staphylococcus microti]SUM56505.1 lipoprotein [Staphylococcus microti]